MSIAGRHTSALRARARTGQTVSERVRCTIRRPRARAGVGRRGQRHLGRAAEMAQDALRGVGGVERRDQAEPTTATGTGQHIHCEHAPHQIGPPPAAAGSDARECSGSGGSATPSGCAAAVGVDGRPRSYSNNHSVTNDCQRGAMKDRLTDASFAAEAGKHDRANRDATHPRRDARTSQRHPRQRAETMR